MPPIEETIIAAVGWLRLVVEAIGAIIIAIGVIVTLVRLAQRAEPGERFHRARYALASYLALALEFQLAADVLSTAVAPSWDQIGKLAAIAVIRTGLNFFLMKEMQDEQRVK